MKVYNECVFTLSENCKINQLEFNTWKNNVISKTKHKISYLKTKTLPSPSRKVTCDQEVIVYLEYLHRYHINVPIDKSANNFCLCM